MTTEDVKQILKDHEDRILVYVALSYVNLSDKELETLILRYMRGLTQERAAEEMDVNKNSVFAWQQSALLKTCKMWERIPFGKMLLQNIQ